MGDVAGCGYITASKGKIFPTLSPSDTVSNDMEVVSVNTSNAFPKNP